MDVFLQLLSRTKVSPTVSKSRASRASVSAVVLLKLLVLEEEREMLALLLLLLCSLTLLKTLLTTATQTRDIPPYIRRSSVDVTVDVQMAP